MLGKKTFINSIVLFQESNLIHEKDSAKKKKKKEKKKCGATRIRTGADTEVGLTVSFSKGQEANGFVNCASTTWRPAPRP